MELTDRERLALVQALYNHFGKYVSTKDPDSLRSIADREYKALFEQTGAKSFEVRINGEKVGTYSIRVSKGKPETTSRELYPVDRDKFREFIADIPTQVIYEYITTNPSDFAWWYVTNTGEVPGGWDWVEETIPAEEPAYMGGTLKVNAEDVANAIRSLNPGLAGLLEGE